MGEQLIMILFFSLGITIVLELVYAVLAGVRDKTALELVLLANILTNPVVVLSYYLIRFHTDWNLVLTKVILEVLAIIVEAFCYKNCYKKLEHPYQLAIGANVFSFIIGAGINVFIK